MLAAALAAKPSPMLGHLVRLTDRMQKQGWRSLPGVRDVERAATDEERLSREATVPGGQPSPTS